MDGDRHGKSENVIDPAHEAMRIWKDLNHHPSLASPLKGTSPWTNSAMVYPVLLFGQALTVFQAGADAGTALLCRSALEAAMYVFLTRRKMEATPVAFWMDPPTGPDGKWTRVGFEELKKEVFSRRVLSQRHEEAIARIQGQGNIIAHLVSRSDEAIFHPPEESLSHPLQLWVTRHQALEDVRDTADVFKTLADSMTSSKESGCQRASSSESFGNRIRRGTSGPGDELMNAGGWFSHHLGPVRVREA